MLGLRHASRIMALATQAAAAARDALASGCNRAALGVLTALWVLGLAATAHADARMYTGSLVIHAFGNDTTTGRIPRYASRNSLAVGIPLTGQCDTNLYHAKETLTFPTTPTGTQVFTFTIPAYGGAERVDTNDDGYPDIVPGCGDETIESGDPLTGSGVAMTTGAISTSRTPMDPRGFTLPQSALNKVKSGASLETYGVYRWEVHFADLRNEAAAFSKSGGDGSFGPIVRKGMKIAKRSVTQTTGKNRFGGTMQLLGSYGDNEGYFNASIGVTSVFYYNWLFNHLGADGQATDMGVVTRGYVRTTPAYGYTVASGGRYTSYVEIEAFKWTTGSVTVTALGGTFPTILRRKGYDHRTAMGSGVVQLVSPMLSRWTGAENRSRSSTAGIGILKISFAPEPASLLMLGAGAIVLGLLSQLRHPHERSLDARSRVAPIRDHA